MSGQPSRGQFLRVAISLAILVFALFPSELNAALTSLSTYGAPNPATPAPAFTDHGGNAYSIAASGTDHWGTSDNGSWLYDPLTTTAGDFTAIVRSTSFNTTAPFSPLAGEWGRTGIMARATADANSANVATMRKSGSSGGGGFGLNNFSIVAQGRNYTGGDTERNLGEAFGTGAVALPNTPGPNLAAGTTGTTGTPDGVPVWLALHRQGSYFYSQYAQDVGGAPGAWSSPMIREVSPALSGSLFVGLAHQAHTVPRINEARLDSFAVTPLDPSFGLTPPPVLFTYAQQPNGKWNRIEVADRAQVTFNDARTRAEALSFGGAPGHLATARSMEENRHLTGVINAARFNGGDSGNAWFGLGDSAVEGAWRLLDAGNDPVWNGIGAERTPPGAPVPGAFTRWNNPAGANNDEPNDGGGNEDAGEIIRAGQINVGRWNDGTAGVTTNMKAFIVEYETQLDSKPEIPALPIQNGSFSVHMIHQHRGDIQHIRAVETLAYSTGVGTHHHSYQPTINFRDEGSGDGNFGGGQPFPGGDPARPDENDFALFARGVVLIPEAGTYTFGFRGDDGSQLRVKGHTFTASTILADAVNHGEPDFVHDGDVLSFPRVTGDGHVLGQVTLPAGPVEIEYSFFENGGGAHSELFAAPGARTAFDSLVFRPIGHVGQWQQRHFYKPGMVDLGGGNHFAMDVCDGPDAPTVPPSRPEDLHTVATAQAYLDNCAAATPGYTSYTGMAAVINHTDPGFPANGGSDGGDLAWPGLDETVNVPPGAATDNNNWATRSLGALEMPADGWVRFHVESDDGFQLLVDGAQFEIVSSGNPALTQVITTASPNDTVQAQYGTGNSNTVLDAFLTAGTHDLMFIHWDGNGGGYAQIRAGGMLLGSSGAMDLGLVNDSGLQLVPEPSSWALAGIALAALAFIRRRRAR